MLDQHSITQQAFDDLYAQAARIKTLLSGFMCYLRPKPTHHRCGKGGSATVGADRDESCQARHPWGSEQRIHPVAVVQHDWQQQREAVGGDPADRRSAARLPART